MIMRHHQAYSMIFLYMSLTAQIQGESWRDFFYFVLAIAVYLWGTWAEDKMERENKK
jgi:hypothetical protein